VIAFTRKLKPPRSSPDVCVPHIPITRAAEAGRLLRVEGPADAAEKSDSGADAAGLERLGSCIVGPKQHWAGRGGTTAAVATR